MFGTVSELGPVLNDAEMGHTTADHSLAVETRLAEVSASSRSAIWLSLYTVKGTSTDKLPFCASTARSAVPGTF